MKGKSILKIAIKNLLRRKSRSFVTMGGLALAIALVVIFVSLGYGLQRMVIKDFTTLEALRTIDVTAEKSEQIQLDNAALDEMEKLELVEDVLPIVEVGAKLYYENSVTDVAVIGLERKVFDMGTSLGVADPQLLDEFGGKKTIVSNVAASLVGLEGDIYQKELSLEISIGTFADEDVTIEEKFEVLTSETTSTSPVILIPIEFLQENGVNRYSIAKVETTSVEDVKDIRQILEKKGYKTRTAQDTVSQIEDIFTIVRFGLAAIGIVAAVVATLGMFNTLTVSLLEKTREVGILKALGAQKDMVLKLFLAEAVIMSIAGGIVGIFLGVFGCGLIQAILTLLARRAGQEMDSVFYFPILFLIGVFVSTVMVGLFTGFYPASKASSIKTLDALRYE